jgi:hypothetical protein
LTFVAVETLTGRRSKKNGMDSLDWSKKYEVLSISGLYLHSLGFSNEQINSLTDEDMDRIALKLNNDYCEHGFDEDLKFIVSLELAEKGIDTQLEGEPE